MSTMEAEVFDAFRSVGVADDKASAAAQALSRHDPDIAILKADSTILKADVTILKSDVTILKADVTILKSDVTILKGDVAILKGDVAAIKADMLVLKWMVGFVGAMVASMVLRIFTH